MDRDKGARVKHWFPAVRTSMFAYGHEEAAYVELPQAKSKATAKSKAKAKPTAAAAAPKESSVESTFVCELRCVQKPPKYKEISRWIVQAPRAHHPGPFETPSFVFLPTTGLVDIHTPFVIISVVVATTSHTYGELCDYQTEYTRPVPDRFVPPRILKSKRYYPKGGAPATGYVDGPSMGVKAIRTKAKKDASGAVVSNKRSRKIAAAARTFDLTPHDAYKSVGLANTPRAVGIRSRPTNTAPRWWVKEIRGVYPRPFPLIANRLPLFCKDWQPDAYTACNAILASIDLVANEPVPSDVLLRLDRLRILSTVKRQNKSLPVVRELENLLRLPMSGVATVNLCAYYPRKALAGLSDAKIAALVNAFRVHAERVLFSAPVYFDLPTKVTFREYEKQALGMVPAFRLSKKKLSITADQIELYRRFLCSAWYRGDVYGTLPETLETEQEREERQAKEEKAREAARKRKAKQRRREEGIGSDDEDFDVVLGSDSEDDDDEGEDLDDYENPGPRKKKKPAKRKRRDKFVVAVQVATQELVESGRFIRLPDQEAGHMAISEYLAEEMQLATYLRETNASVRVVENLRNMEGYTRYLAHEQEGALLQSGVVFAFAPTEVEADRFTRLSMIATRCHAQLTTVDEEQDGSVEIDTLVIVGAEQLGNAYLFRILRRFSIKRHLILIGNPKAWRDPRYLGCGQPFRTLYDTAYNYKPATLSICTLSEDDLGEVDAEKVPGSPSLLSEACRFRRWEAGGEAKHLLVTANRAKKVLDMLASDADLWPNVQVFQSGFVHHDKVRELCPSPCPAFTGKSGMIRVGQRLYLRDTGERLVVAACGIGSTAGTMARWDTNPASCLENVSMRRLNAIVETTLPLAKEHRKREYCGCTTSKQPKRFFPHRHHVTDGSCINIRQYSGPSVEIAFLLAGNGTCRKDLITLASVTSKQCYIVSVDDKCNIYSVVTANSRDGWEPNTQLEALIVGEEQGASIDDE